MHINDVGQGTWEEINVGAAGANFGWPTCEGTCGTAGMTNPIYQYSSAVGAPCAITGGAFYNPTTQMFPAQFIGKYFFADFCAGWIKTIDPLNPPATGTAVDAFTNISLPVDIQVANDGSLYYLARGASAVFRVQYVGGPTLAINDLTIAEGNAGTSVATFNVLLSPASFANSDGELRHCKQHCISRHRLCSCERHINFHSRTTITTGQHHD